MFNKLFNKMRAYEPKEVLKTFIGDKPINLFELTKKLYYLEKDAKIKGQGQKKTLKIDESTRFGELMSTVMKNSKGFIHINNIILTSDGIIISFPKLYSSNKGNKENVDKCIACNHLRDRCNENCNCIHCGGMKLNNFYDITRCTDTDTCKNCKKRTKIVYFDNCDITNFTKDHFRYLGKKVYPCNAYAYEKIIDPSNFIKISDIYKYYNEEYSNIYIKDYSLLIKSGILDTRTEKDKNFDRRKNFIMAMSKFIIPELIRTIAMFL